MCTRTRKNVKLKEANKLKELRVIKLCMVTVVLSCCVFLFKDVMMSLPAGTAAGSEVLLA